MKLVLLIEPDRVLAKSYKSALENAGYKVDQAGDAQDAVNLVDKNLPDLVIVELQLSAHSGFEFLYEFRSYKEWQSIPIIIQSGIPPSEFMDNRAMLESELGVKAYLYKPVTSLDSLVETVESLISSGVKSK